MSLRLKVEDYLRREIPPGQDSKATESAYRNALLSFVSYSQRRGVDDLLGVTARLVEEFQNDQGSVNSRNTAIYRTRLIKRFIANCFEQGDIPSNPAKGVRVLKKEKRLPEVMSDKEFDDFIYTAISFRKYPRKADRDRAVIDTLAYTGLRRSELLDLSIADIDLEGRKLLVRHGKGGKQRVVPLHETLFISINNYLKHRPRVKTDFLFLASDGRSRLGKNGLYKLFRRHLKRCGIQRKGITLHTVRHSVASRVLRKSKDLVSVQKLLGHESLETTSIYLHVTAEDVRKAIDVSF